jgi:hypothetical protein
MRGVIGWFTQGNVVANTWSVACLTLGFVVPFLDESGQRSYKKDAEFARGYGKTNPYEDYATTWEVYFMKQYHGTANGGNVVEEKLTALDAFLASLR